MQCLARNVKGCSGLLVVDLWSKEMIRYDRLLLPREGASRHCVIQVVQSSATACWTRDSPQIAALSCLQEPIVR